MTRSTFLHLRIPFSFFLLPVFLFALAISTGVDWMYVALVGVSLHFFLYPASNAYNSYFDKDDESIGGLKNPPKVSKELYWYSLLFDAVALILGAFINWQFVIMLLIYGLISKAYSHPQVRLKKMPYFGWFVVGLFQGYFTFLMIYLGLNELTFTELMASNAHFPGILCSLLLWGSYPMTQIYQHSEDQKRGDITLSLKLGINGTFHFTGIAFFFATLGYVYFFYSNYSLVTVIAYLLLLSPVLIFFSYWYIKARKGPEEVNYSNTMRLNFISSLMLNIFFLLLILSIVH
ncbi:MAG: UbiA prenyltransferase family protein [Cyclobacteriaceae bacterium]